MWTETTTYEKPEKPKTKMTLETNDGTYSVDIPHNDVNIDDMMNIVVGPLLKAAGYSEKLVDEYLGDG